MIKIIKNNGILQYRYSVIDTNTGHYIDNTNWLIEAIYIKLKAQRDK